MKKKSKIIVPSGASRPKKTLYQLMLAAYRGDGGPGIIEWNFPMEKEQYDIIIEQMKRAGSISNFLLKTIDMMEELTQVPGQATLTLSTVFNHTADRVAYLQAQKYYDSGTSIVDPMESFGTPVLKVAKGYTDNNEADN